jgi:hypothetical protein
VRHTLHEIVRANQPEDDPHRKRESSPSGIVHDGWCGSFKLACSSGNHISDPFAFPTVGERNEKSLRVPEKHSPVSGRVCLTFDPRESECRSRAIGAANRLVIRFVTAKLNAATHRLRNRIEGWEPAGVPETR